MRTLTTLLGLALTGALAEAGGIAPYTETFSLDSAQWRDGVSSPLAWNPGGFVSTAGDLNAAGPFGLTLFRAQDNFDSSGDAFAGDYVAGGIDTLSFDIRHDAGVSLAFSVRFAVAANNSAFVLFSPTLVESGVWTTVSLAIDPSSPFYIEAGGSYASVAPAIANVQLFVARPDGLATPLVVNFDLDNVSITPAPAGAALLGLCGLLATRRRRA